MDVECRGKLDSEQVRAMVETHLDLSLPAVREPFIQAAIQVREALGLSPSINGAI